MKKKALILSLFFVVTFAFLMSAHAAIAKRHHHGYKSSYIPIIFIHGGSGSASQFESQAMRFTSNGYPQAMLFAYEYDSSYSINTRDEILEGLDAFIAEVMELTGNDKVNIMGHSHGTTIMHDYLGRPEGPERAQNIAHYVNIDGRTASEPPGGVSTLAIWAGRGTPGREIVGAVNVTLDNQTHIQSATSPEAFYEMYKFLTGKPPLTTTVLPQFRGRIELAGRVSLFPQNIGADGAILKIFEICGQTGERLHKKPKEVYAIDGDGHWGPFKGKFGRCYEFVIVREDSNHHLYKEPFIRSDHFIRLLTSPVGGGVAQYMHRDEGQSNLVVMRDKEFWGDQGIENDILAISGVNIVNETNSYIDKRTSTYFVYDLLSDGESDLYEPIALYHSLPFITGVDLFIPAANPPDGRTRLTLISRDGEGMIQMINIPNWPSTTDRISVQFNDFVQWDVIPGFF